MSSERNGLSCQEAGLLGYYASRETQNKLKLKRINKYYENPKRCKNCGKVITYDKRGASFCNSSCAATYNNKLRGPRSEETKDKIRKTMESKRDPIKKIKYCKHCGAIKGQCKDSWVCSKFQLFKSLQKFGFNINTIGTENVINEFYRIKAELEAFYLLNSTNEIALKNVYNYTSGAANFAKILKSLNIETRNSANAISEAWASGRMPIPTEAITKYHSCWHTTWDDKEVYLRSSYELEYAQELDSKQIKYDVESLRIKYFDTKENIFRCAIPDFYLPDTNTIVEIKSTWTYDEQNMKDKFRAYKDLGYNTKLILDKKELIID